MSALGKPVVLIATDAFLALAKTHARSLGSPDLPIMTVRHPLGGLSLADVTARAEETVVDLVRLVTDPPDSGG